MANKDSDVYQNLVRIEEPEARIHVDAPDGVLPLALNVELPGGYVSEAVPSGVRLPHTATAMFSTADSFQLAAEFHILMGNRPLACDNIPLCRIRVRNIKWLRYRRSRHADRIGREPRPQQRRDRRVHGRRRSGP